MITLFYLKKQMTQKIKFHFQPYQAPFPDDVLSIDNNEIEKSFKGYLEILSAMGKIKVHKKSIKTIDNYPMRTNIANGDTIVFIPNGQNLDDGANGVLVATQNLEYISEYNSEFNPIKLYKIIDKTNPAFIHTAVNSDWGGDEGLHEHELHIVR